MEWKLFENAAQFSAAARPFLEKDEVLHNLPLGIMEHIITGKYSDFMLAALFWSGAVAGVALRTPPQHLILSALNGPEPGTVFEALAAILKNVDRQLPGVIGPNDEAGTFAQQWAAQTGASVNLLMKQRVFKLTEVQNLPLPAGKFRRAVVADEPLLAEWISAFNAEAMGEGQPGIDLRRVTANIVEGHYFVWETDRPVALAARNRESRHGWVIGPVYTPPEERGNGYATACVMELSRLNLREGKEFCSLFTDLANPTSNRIYQRIGYRAVADFRTFTFGY